MSKIQLIGHEAAKNFLQNSWQRNSLSHAYLIFGPEGIGKFTLVNNFIAYLFCEKHQACGKCLPCQQVQRGNHPDVWLIERQIDKQDITIEQIRQLHDFISLGSYDGGWRIVVIDGAQYLNAESGNALLKSLEEPADKVIFFLLSAEPKKLLATISSRCQVLNLGFVPTKEIVKLLQEQGAATKLAEELAQLSGGRPGVALNLFNRPEDLARQLREAKLFLDLLTNSGFKPAVKYFETEFKETNTEFMTSRQQAQRLINIWRTVARDLWCYKFNLKKYLRYSTLESELKKSSNLNLPQLWRVSRLLQEADKRLAANAHIRLTLEWAAYTLGQI